MARGIAARHDGHKRVCENCGREYPLHDDQQKYCNRTCKMQAYWKRRALRYVATIAQDATVFRQRRI